MKRYFQQNKPYLKKKEKVVVEEKNVKLRSILFLFFIIIAVAAFVIAGANLASVDKGWTTIKHGSSKINCADDFSLQYNLGAGELSASNENKKVVNLYSTLVEKAYQLFTTDEVYDHNIAYINQHLNEVIEVDSFLYQSFDLLQKYDNRLVFLGPIYQLYDNLFYVESDAEAYYYDGKYDSTVKQFYDEVLDYVHNDAVSLQLLGNNQIKLVVSESYQAFLKANEVTDVIDFYWMKNAFIIDYFALQFKQAGLTTAVISSVDGYAINLDDNNGEVNFVMYDLIDKVIYQPCYFSYNEHIALVSLRNFPSISMDYYYGYQNGDIATRYLNYQDGDDITAVNSLISYGDYSCSELLMNSVDLYCAKDIEQNKIDELKDKDISTLYCKDLSIYHNGNANITNVFVDENIKYILKEK